VGNKRESVVSQTVTVTIVSGADELTAATEEIELGEADQNGV